jgi:hypothetical protein
VKQATHILATPAIQFPMVEELMDDKKNGRKQLSQELSSHLPWWSGENQEKQQPECLGRN